MHAVTSQLIGGIILMGIGGFVLKQFKLWAALGGIIMAAGVWTLLGSFQWQADYVKLRDLLAILAFIAIAAAVAQRKYLVNYVLGGLGIVLGLFALFNSWPINLVGWGNWVSVTLANFNQFWNFILGRSS